MSTKTLIYETLHELYGFNKKLLSVSQFSDIQSPIQTTSTFANNDDFKLPLQISGRLVTAGTYKDEQFGEITLEPRELKKVLNLWEGVGIYTDHGVFRAINRNADTSVRNVVGKITRTVWNERDRAIDFFAEIVDEDIARKILHGLIKFISVGFGRTPEFLGEKVFLRNITPKESSLVFNPRDKSARFQPIAG